MRAILKAASLLPIEDRRAVGPWPARYTGWMKTLPLLAVALLTGGFSSSVAAQVPLPADWEQQVSRVIPEPDRARQVVEAGRGFEASRQAWLDAMKVANAEAKAVFLTQASSVKERQLQLNLYRDDRRKAAMATVDAVARLKSFAWKKEWKELWPKGFFSTYVPAALLAPKVREALPSVVADPARLQQAQAAADGLVKAATADENARKKESGRFAELLDDYDTPRDRFIEIVDKLEQTQVKADDTLIGAAGELQRVLTAEEWAALVQKVGGATP